MQNISNKIWLNLLTLSIRGKIFGNLYLICSGVKGARSGAYESTDENARIHLRLVLKTVINPTGAKPSPTTLASYITTDNPSWGGFVLAFRQTARELTSMRSVRILSRTDIFGSIRTAYMGILWRDFSIDLVAASLRQREFAKRITGMECTGLDTPSALFKATTRYHKFLLLMSRKGPASRRPTVLNLVPTLDIDLCWHTHQLFPVPYRTWCIQHLGTAINHDDTINQANLTAGLRATSLLWHKSYQEQYTTDDLRRAYVSPFRMFMGVLFPPYGMHLVKKAKKLEQARLGTYRLSPNIEL